MKRRTPPHASPRRTQLLRTALLPALLVCSSLLSAQVRGGARQFMNQTAAIEIDGSAVPVRNVEGGTPVGNVVVEGPGPDGSTKKHIAGVKYEDITADVGFGEGSRALLDWVSAALRTAAPVTKSGRVLVGDFNGKTTESRDFQNAFISGFTVPTLDAASRTAATFTVQITPATVLLREGGGAEMKAPMGGKQQQQWLSSNFRLELDGLEASRVVRVDSFTIGRSVARDAIGETREPTRMPGKLEIPNITVTLSEMGSESWKKWRDDFLLRGNNSDANEKSGAIVFLGPDMKSELGRITLDHCGLVQLAPDAAGSPNDRVSRLTAELYCERMGFESKGGR